MAGLSPKERTGITELLKLMDEKYLGTLLETVTNRKKCDQTRGSVEELIEDIISNINDAAGFLNKRRVQRDFIIQYLAKEDIKLQPSCGKPQLVEITLKFWKDGEKLPAANPAETSLDQSGGQFCDWFFDLLNGQNPSFGQEPTPGAWGPQHFCKDAQLNINSEIGQHVGLYQGADQVNLCLLSLVREEGLFFSPSLEDHRCQVVDPLRRLVIVTVDGTISSPLSNQDLGNFKQMFGVCFMPDKITWEIQFTDLIIRKVGWNFDELKLRFT